MATYFLDLEGGSDAANGTSFGDNHIDRGCRHVHNGCRLLWQVENVD